MMILILLYSFLAHAQDWGKDYQLPQIPEESDSKFTSYNRENILNLPQISWKEMIIKGRKHTFVYPVSNTELLIPYKALESFFSSEEHDPIRRVLIQWSQDISNFRSMSDVFSWLGVHDYPAEPTLRFPSPWPDLSEKEKKLPLGATLINRQQSEGLTFSCAACHSSDLFGVKVLGLTNRFPRANEFFRLGKAAAPFVDPHLFQHFLKLSKNDRLMFEKSRDIMKYVGVKKPQALGLDTSLAQVALSLSRRNNDPYATRNPMRALFPKPNPLEKDVIADSKPAVWWNVKYKTRWLSDGSIIQGNPVHTNFLWNELGRGMDLKKLETWMKTENDKIKELTAAVFASQAPKYLDFFPEKTFNLTKAKRGQVVYQQSCQKCHGEYIKNWDQPNANEMGLKDLIQTHKVRYHKKTPVIDVGTDPGRYQGMKYFAKELNQLKISQSIKTIVEPQKGYVPPPLVGIWARYPYFHNNSVPNLCELLTPADKRTKIYVAGPAINTETDFDTQCLGYPKDAPTSWAKNPDYHFDTQKKGLSNRGHDEGIFLKDGIELLSPLNKSDLIEFLKTL